MIDPGTVCFYLPRALAGFKRPLYEQIAAGVGRVAETPAQLTAAVATHIPAAACFLELRDHFRAWRAEGRPWIYLDRGYLRRGRLARGWLPPGEHHGYWRWHLNAFQMDSVAPRPMDRLQRCMIHRAPWQPGGRHIVVAAPSEAYASFHGLGRDTAIHRVVKPVRARFRLTGGDARVRTWVADTVAALRQHTDRQIVVREKMSTTPLAQQLAGAHALVTHGSIAAVEAVVMGVPVFVDPVSAARHVGLTDLSLIESPVLPDREPWLAALAYCQFDEREMIDGTMWRLLE